MCREEAPPETTARATFVVEAKTASGACTLRVAALPLPAGVASALDQNADLLRGAFAAAARGGGGGEQQQQQAAAAGAAGAGTAAADAHVGGGMGAPGSDSLAAFGEHLRRMAADADAEAEQQPGSAAGSAALLAMLQRAWMFGPKRTVPNLLLASAASSSSSSSGGLAPLFSLPPERIVKLAKQPGGRSAAVLVASVGRQHQEQQQQHQDDAGGQGNAEQQQEAEEAARRHLAVPLGFPDAAQKLGLVAGEVAAAAHATSAVAELACQIGSQLSVSTHSGSTAAPQNGGTEGGLGRSLEYLRYSIESGVASGFQLASATGPLCDEPLWGVAVQVEARLNLSPAAAAAGEAGAAQEAASLQLAEDVYGPFSGQVSQAMLPMLRL